MTVWHRICHESVAGKGGDHGQVTGEEEGAQRVEQDSGSRHEVHGAEGRCDAQARRSRCQGKVFKEVVLPGFGPTGRIQGGSYSANDIAQDIK